MRLKLLLDDGCHTRFPGQRTITLYRRMFQFYRGAQARLQALRSADGTQLVDRAGFGRTRTVHLMHGVKTLTGSKKKTRPARAGSLQELGQSAGPFEQYSL